MRRSSLTVDLGRGEAFSFTELCKHLLHIGLALTEVGEDSKESRVG